MKVLVVCSENSGSIAPFVQEQTNSIEKLGVETTYFTIKGKGVSGYLGMLKPFRKVIRKFKPDIIHAHYGLCGLFANLQRKIPVVCTYHGSDINSKKDRKYSQLSIWLSAQNIFVNKYQPAIAKVKTNYSIIPCGIDLSVFKPMDKTRARLRLNLDPEQKLLLFSSRFDIPVKNVQLVKKAIDKLPFDVNLLELKGYSREEVNLLLNAADVAVLSSISEGSPMFIKEAMACNCPLVSTDVGDVRELFGKTAGCFIAGFDAEAYAVKMQKAIQFSQNEDRAKGRERIYHLGLDGESIAEKIIEVYGKVLNESTPLQ